MAQVVTKGLVIREQPYQERDKLLTIFTTDYGKQKAIARGVRQSKSSMAAATQLFAYGEFVYYPGKNFANLNQASVIESFYPLRSDMRKMSLGSYVLEILDSLFDFHQGNPKLMQVALYVLYYLSKNMVMDDRIPVAAFALKAAEAQGFRPVLDQCANCGIKEDLLYFNGENGGILCRDCSHSFGMTFKLLPDQLAVMQKLLASPVKDLRSLSISDEMITRIMTVMDHHLSEHLGRSLKSWQFYKALL